MIMLKKILYKRLSQIKNCTLTIRDGSKTLHFGDKNNALKAEIIVNDERFYSFIIFGGSIGASEAFMNRFWDTPDLTNVIKAFSRNYDLTNKLESKFNLLLKPFFQFIHFLNKNSKKNSKRNISAHYDLSNDFFSMFLDKSMMYSSAIFANKNQDLYGASLNKLDIICKKLNLKKSDHVVEIGTGWGGFAIFAAENFGCKVTTTTISKEQYNFTKKLIKEKKLGKKVTLLFTDYRDLKGKYDKLVSIEMIEAVGHQYYSEYFKQINNLLKENGAALIQAITIRDQNYLGAVKSVDFIQRYIFPGSCIPSIEVIQKTISSQTNMIISDLENINHHYAKTLFMWNKNFNKNITKIKKLGFDDRFSRMWNFYFSYCEGGFDERVINDYHILMTKPLNKDPQNEKDIL